MNKSDLVDAMAGLSGMHRAEASKALDAFIEVVSSELQKGDTITLVGFGTFSVSERAARSARNPRTGETVEVPASKVARFKPGKQLKSAVANEEEQV